MRLFEIHSEVRPGFRITIEPGRIGVRVGEEQFLPLGNSIAKFLAHPDDQRENFLLLHAELQEAPRGLCLTKQGEKEAMEDPEALVFVIRNNDEQGVTRVEPSRKHPTPALILTGTSPGYVRELYLFKPGDGLYFYHPAAVLGLQNARCTIVEWTGERFEQQSWWRGWGRRRSPKPPVSELRA